MTSTWLTNQFLIAMPAMGDPNFDRTVTFICEHNEDGALGLVVNRPLGMKLSDVLGQMSLGGNSKQLDEIPILRGGPVQPERGFVVHDQLGEWGSTMEVSEGIHVTTSRDILEAMAEGGGPEHALVILGYAGWAAGQLENEMIVNAWLTVPADKDVLFAMPFEKRWQAAAALIGIDINQLGSSFGHA
ncbi:MAG: YqgE/AlgH family protein [Gammaproteobacteria bacterium]